MVSGSYILLFCLLFIVFFFFLLYLNYYYFKAQETISAEIQEVMTPNLGPFPHPIGLPVEL